jgi:hypothetical protein
MFTVLAAGVGISYLVLGWSANTVSFVSREIPQSHLRILTRLAHHLHLSERVFRKRPLKIGFLLRRRGKLSRKLDRPHGERPNPTLAASWNRYGHGVYLHLQRRRLHRNLLLLRLETHTPNRLLVCPHHPSSRLLPSQI